jgi:hypothetical protein
MAVPSQGPVPPIIPVVDIDDGQGTDGSDRETVGASDAAADAARAGADVNLDRADRESDGVPVGRDDLRSDIERSGGDPDAA